MKRDVFGIYATVTKTFRAAKDAGQCPVCKLPMLAGQTLARASRQGFSASPTRGLEHLACAAPSKSISATAKNPR